MIDINVTQWIKMLPLPEILVFTQGANNVILSLSQ